MLSCCREAAALSLKRTCQRMSWRVSLVREGAAGAGMGTGFGGADATAPPGVGAAGTWAKVMRRVATPARRRMAARRAGMRRRMRRMVLVAALAMESEAAPAGAWRMRRTPAAKVAGAANMGAAASCEARSDSERVTPLAIM